MDKDLTHITVVLDRSGSMATCKEDAEGGLNTFVEKQKEQSGKCTFTMVEFDDHYDVVYNSVPIQEVEPYTLAPRGCTALLDAIGKAITTTGERLENLPESRRPSKVVVVIITDGQENSSKEYTRSQIKDMIDRQTNTYKWEFTFIGADQEAFDEASSMGIRRGTTLQYDPANTQCMFASLSSNVSAYRAGVVSSLDYSAEQRSSAVGGISDG